ncbi:MAG TPA: ROK family transcriptional regulator [Candidatus Limnocylindrales bacterium]|nr:ROK family transcriptional regulator [Candidatus Limnocylindrales bacterium]
MALPTKATHRQTRVHNERLVVRTLYDFGPISRAEVARLTGLTRTTVSDVVAVLLDDGVVHEVGRGPSSGGKAPILVEVDNDARLVVGLDLGEEHFSGSLVNLRGEIRRSVALPVGGRDGEAAVQLVFDLLDQLLERGAAPLLGIGIGTPGLVDSRTGTIRQAVNLDWRDLPLGQIVSQRYGVPTNVANDSQAAALAEYTFAGGDRVPNLIAIRVGRGIGAGLILRGALFQGDGSGAGEIGHIVVDDDGALCRCGRTGCLETVAAMLAIETQAAVATGQPTDLAAIRSAADAGEAWATDIIDAAGAALGRSIAALIGVLDVQRIVLLGPVTALGDRWLSAVRREAGRRALALLADDVDIQIGRPTTNIVIRGASSLLVARELGLSLVR